MYTTRTGESKKEKKNDNNHNNNINRGKEKERGLIRPHGIVDGIVYVPISYGTTCALVPLSRTRTRTRTRTRARPESLRPDPQEIIYFSNLAPYEILIIKSSSHPDQTGLALVTEKLPLPPRHHEGLLYSRYKNTTQY